jgi:hypothetical protein
MAGGVAPAMPSPCRRTTAKGRARPGRRRNRMSASRHLAPGAARQIPTKFGPVATWRMRGEGLINQAAPPAIHSRRIGRLLRVFLFLAAMASARFCRRTRLAVCPGAHRS